MDRDELDMVAVGDPHGRGFLAVPRGEVSYIEQVYGTRAEVGRGPQDPPSGLPVCIYRAHRMAESLYKQSLEGGRIYDFERYPLEVRELATMSADQMHQCNEDCWPPQLDRIQQLLFKWQKSRQETIAMYLLGTYNRVVREPNDAVYEEMMALAADWDKQLYMIPDHAIVAVYNLAEVDAGERLVELDHMRRGWDTLQRIMQDRE